MIAEEPIPALVPADKQGHQFVFYADSCSGIPGGRHEKTFAAVNDLIRRLRPQPEFICFPGDEIVGLTHDEARLRDQWAYWLDHEMGWLNRLDIPLYHTTANHTIYGEMSERVFADVLSHLPRNSPPGQEGLSYFVRRDDLLMVFVNTLCSDLGGEGYVETNWLDQTLQANRDASFKLVFGHHPVFSCNGFSGPCQRDIEPQNGREFWSVLVRHGVMAYLCSHMLAYDVQVHEGVLQILTAGAGTMPHMPADTEYLHCIQGALDAQGLRYQVLDTTGKIREWLTWPLRLPPSGTWRPTMPARNGEHYLAAWNITGRCVADGCGKPQTILSGWRADQALSPLWIGLRGREQRLIVSLCPAPGRSPHQWHGPTLRPGEPFQIQVGIHSGMGPGGILWRWNETHPWNSLRGVSSWGGERLEWPEQWSTGHDQLGADHEPFRGAALQIGSYSQPLSLFR